MPNDPIRIKRYPNRRFYASHTRSYLSLAEIEEMVHAGANVEIVDNQTGEDLTRAVLVQMIAERHPDKIAMFPTAMLHSILRANDMVANFLRDYFRNSVAYLDYLNQHGSTGSLPQPVHWMKAWLESWSKPTNDSGATKRRKGAKTSDSDSDSQMAARIKQLEQRIADLEKTRQS